MNNSSLQNKIDLYHAGRMSPEDQVLFEAEMRSDPSIQSESDLQRDIIEGLKEVRKAELKARLSAIEVQHSWMAFVQQSSLLKSIGGAIVASLVGTGIYLFLTETSHSDDESYIVINAPEPNDLGIDWSIEPAKFKDLSSKSLSETISLASKRPEETSAKKEIVKNDDIAQIMLAKKESIKSEKVKSGLDLNFTAPDAEKIEDEEAMETSSLELITKTTTPKESLESIDVSYEISKNLDIKYKYYDGKLFLSGDFDRAPYEILEINSADARRIFVYYLDHFYQVGVTDKLTKLPEVKEVSLIQELKMLRNNK